MDISYLHLVNATVWCLNMNHVIRPTPDQLRCSFNVIIRIPVACPFSICNKMKLQLLYLRYYINEWLARKKKEISKWTDYGYSYLVPLLVIYDLVHLFACYFHLLIVTFILIPQLLSWLSCSIGKKIFINLQSLYYTVHSSKIGFKFNGQTFGV